MRAKTLLLKKLLVCTALTMTFCMTTACGNDTNNSVTDDNTVVPGDDSTVPEDNMIEDSTNPVDDMNENNADNALDENELPAEKADGVPDEVNGTNETGGASADGVAGDAVDDVIDGAEDVGDDVVDTVEDLGDDAADAVDDVTGDEKAVDDAKKNR